MGAGGKRKSGRLSSPARCLLDLPGGLFIIADVEGLACLDLCGCLGGQAVVVNLVVAVVVQSIADLRRLFDVLQALNLAAGAAHDTWAADAGLAGAAGLADAGEGAFVDLTVAVVVDPVADLGLGGRRRGAAFSLGAVFGTVPDALGFAAAGADKADCSITLEVVVDDAVAVVVEAVAEFVVRHDLGLTAAPAGTVAACMAALRADATS